MEKKRTSNIELLKVIAMIIIVLAHNTPVANNVKLRGELEFLIDGNLATANWQELIVDIGIYFSQFAVCIFFVCSVWFLVDSKAVKPRKILYMWVDLFFFSVVYAVVIKIIYPEMTWETFIKSFFPFSTNETWYISCYVLLYAIHPLLNVVIYGIAKRTLLLSVMITSVLYGVIMFFVPGGGWILLQSTCWIYSYLFHHRIFEDIPAHFYGKQKNKPDFMYLQLCIAHM